MGRVVVRCGHTGRPSVDPGPMLRMLLIGDLFSFRSDRRLVGEIHLNPACRWFCPAPLVRKRDKEMQRFQNCPATKPQIVRPI